VATSTALSVAWHWYAEPAGLLFYADYGAAAVLSLYPLIAVENEDIPTCVALEGWIFALNIISNSICGPDSYEVVHSIWHVASAAKCIWVAWLLRYGTQSLGNK
jgi:hypothetical protein